MHPNDLTLSEYVDRTLGRDEHAVVARHLETCEVCRQLVDDLREITRAAAALDPIAPPSRVWGRIEQEICRDPGPAGPGGIPLAWTWPAAAAVLVLAVFIGVGQNPSKRPGGGGLGPAEGLCP